MRSSLRIAVLCILAAGAPAYVHAQWTWTPQTGRWVNIKNMPKETAELQIEYARSLMLEGKHKKALHETQKFTKFYTDDPLTSENQYLRGEIQNRQGKLMAAAKEFQQVVVNYPGTARYDEAVSEQYAIGDAFYDKGLKKMRRKWNPFRQRPLRRAVDVYSMVVENQPFAPAAAEAQYKIGLCQYTRKNYIEAAFEYRRAIEDYGGSEWVDEAGYGLAMCYYDMSYPPEYDQSPSKLAMNAINDFTSRYPSDKRVPDLREKREEMRARIAQQKLKVARFYEKRREFDATRIYYEAVVDQFPETPASDAAGEWLTEHPVILSEVRRDFEALRGAP